MMGYGFDVLRREGHQSSGQVGQRARDGQFIANVIDVAVGRIEPGQTDADRLLIAPAQPRLRPGVAFVFVDRNIHRQVLADVV